MRPTIFPALGLATLVVAPARAAEPEALRSAFTENDFELKRDDRLFALYTAFNVAGFDRAEEQRASPFPKRLFHPMRKELRDVLLRQADVLRPGIDAFLDTHPAPLDAYVEAALTLSEGWSFSATEATPSKFEGLDRALTEFAKTAKLEKIAAALNDNYRAEFKRLRLSVDAPFAALRNAFHLDPAEAPTLVLVPMPFDGAGNAVARRIDGKDVVVFGLSASGGDELKAALQAYARLLSAEAVKGLKAEGLKDAVEAARSAGLLEPDASPSSVVTESLIAAAEAFLTGAEGTAAVDVAQRRGLLLTRELHKALAEPSPSFPAEKGSFVNQVVERANVKALAAEYGAKPAAGGRPRK